MGEPWGLDETVSQVRRVVGNFEQVLGTRSGCGKGWESQFEAGLTWHPE